MSMGGMEWRVCNGICITPHLKLVTIGFATASRCRQAVGLVSGVFLRWWVLVRASARGRRAFQPPLVGAANPSPLQLGRSNRRGLESGVDASAQKPLAEQRYLTAREKPVGA